MIKKPCFHLSDHDDGWNDDRIHECGPKPLCTRSGKKLYWSTCKSGKRHPFYANWQRMFETPAAGPWRTDDLTALPEKGEILLKYRGANGTFLSLAFAEFLNGKLPEHAIAWAEIDTEVL